MSQTTTSRRADAGFWSNSKTFFLPVGSRIDAAGVAGYPIDMRIKADSPDWPRPQLLQTGSLHVGATQYALGCYERWLAGEGTVWRDACLAAARHLLAIQEPDGSWVHNVAFPHTFPLPAPWASGITQGQGASLFVRMYHETGETAFVDGAKLALRPLYVPQGSGGLRGELGGRPWPEEYPTRLQSHVLNGAMFALWGMRDVGIGLDVQQARQHFEEGVDSVAANLYRYDTGYWSYYSLYPHPVHNRASSFYHGLHINQLAVMAQLAPRPEFDETRRRWEDYASSRVCRSQAFAWKAAFRLVVPRNRLLAHRLPWTRLPDKN